MPERVLAPNQKHADELFFKAMTGSFDTDLKNNASLDLDSIKKLSIATLDSDSEVHVTNTAVHRRYVSICYQVAGPLLPGNGMSITIYNCADASITQSTMRKRLERWMNDIQKMFRKPEQPLGQVPLESDLNVLWVRNALHVRLALVGGRYMCRDFLFYEGHD